MRFCYNTATIEASMNDNEDPLWVNICIPFVALAWALMCLLNLNDIE